MLVAVLDHALEFGAVVGLGGLRPVYVVADDLDIVEVGVVDTLSELGFNTRLILFFRSNSCVDDCFHDFYL